jgi:hypothetical protein
VEPDEPEAAIRFFLLPSLSPLDPAPSLLAGRFLRLVVDKELRGVVGDFGCPTAFEPLGALAAGLLPPLREDI